MQIFFKYEALERMRPRTQKLFKKINLHTKHTCITYKRMNVLFFSLKRLRIAQKPATDV